MPDASDGAVLFGATEADARRNRELGGAGLVEDPYPVYHQLLKRCPIEHGSLDQHFPSLMHDLDGEGADDGAITVHGYQPSRDALSQADVLSSEEEERYAGFNLVIGRSVLGMDEPDHRRMRLLLQPAFSKKNMEQWKDEIIQPIVDEYLRRIRSLGKVDLYDEVAPNVPIEVISVALGLPSEDQRQFFDWAIGMTSGTDVVGSASAVRRYVAPLIAERRASPKSDLLSVLIEARIEDTDADDLENDRPLTDEEINAFVCLLITAGAGTTYKAYGNLMFMLLSNPTQLAAVRDDRSLVASAIEESLRMEQPLASLARVAIRDTSIGDVAIAKGCPVTINLGAANRDPEQWGSEPDKFDIHRKLADRHLAFGFGVHHCLGIHLARAELSVLLNRTLDLLPNVRFDPDEPLPHVTGRLFRMPTALPVIWDV